MKEDRINKVSALQKGRSKRLTELDVEYIRKNHIKGDKKFGAKAMANRFNVGTSTIYGILNYKIWKLTKCRNCCKDIGYCSSQFPLCSMLCKFLFYTEKIDNGCWIWNGQTMSDRYGVIKMIKHGKETREFARRFSYELKFGKLPKNKNAKKKQSIYNSCGTKLCVNPDHLTLDSHDSHDLQVRRVCQVHRRALTMEQAREIRSLYKRGVYGRGHRALSKKFNVSRATISRIVDNITYLDK